MACNELMYSIFFYQEEVLPVVLANPPNNLFVQGQSKCGKSLLCLIAVLHKIDVELNSPQAVFVTSSQELAIHMERIITSVCKFTQVSCGFTSEIGKRNLHIIIGSIKDLASFTDGDLVDLKKIKIATFDEADVVLTTERAFRLISKLNEDCQIIATSATYNRSSLRFINNVKEVKLEKQDELRSNTKHVAVLCNTIQAKKNIIHQICELISAHESAKVLIFCNSKNTAKWMANELKGKFRSVGVLCGDMAFQDRLTAIDWFNVGVNKILVTTNMFSRGFNVFQLKIVVNFDMPVDKENIVDTKSYMQRIGRAGEQSVAFNLIHSLNDIERIENRFQIKMDVINN